MMVYEYLCPDCQHTWSDIADLPAIECPDCKSEDPIVTWRARAYD